MTYLDHPHQHGWGGNKQKKSNWDRRTHRHTEVHIEVVPILYLEISIMISRNIHGTNIIKGEPKKTYQSFFLK